MQNTTPFFDGFHICTLGRKSCGEAQRLAKELQALKEKSLSQLGECFRKFIPESQLKPSNEKHHSRQRIFSKENTFWAFFSQIIDADGGCMEVVRKTQALAAICGLKIPASSTSAYCQARSKLKESALMNIFRHTAQRIDNIPEKGFLKGRRVIVVDGTGVSMPDTAANQSEWPQQSTQKEGCGFPTARICGCFSLATGGLLSFEIGNKKSHELRLLRKQLDTFRDGDVFLGDKGFCNYFDMAGFKKRGVDSVVTLALRKPVKAADAHKKLGENDLIISWKKPVRNKTSAYSREEWEALPSIMRLRQIKVSVDVPGWRVKSFYIVTTLLDHEKYSATELADLYFQRWDVELFFRDIKTTMGMDILKCKSPEMVRKEIIMHFIAYNCIRMLMYEAAEEYGVGVDRLSFKGSLQALRQWEPHLNHAKISRRERRRIISHLYDVIAENELTSRPGRQEPRCVKRRPKPFQFLTRKRHKMKEIPHRSTYSLK